jgi:hypothetical protein
LIDRDKELAIDNFDEELFDSLKLHEKDGFAVLKTKKL